MKPLIDQRKNIEHFIEKHRKGTIPTDEYDKKILELHRRYILCLRNLVTVREDFKFIPVIDREYQAVVWRNFYNQKYLSSLLDSAKRDPKKILAYYLNKSNKKIDITTLTLPLLSSDFSFPSPIENKIWELKLLEKYNLVRPGYQSLLIVGDSDSGKTTLARYISAQLERVVLLINAQTLTQYSRRDTELLLRYVFEFANNPQNSKVTILFDDLDFMVNTHKNKFSRLGAIASLLLSILNKNKLTNRVLVIGTTSNFNVISKSIVDRFSPILSIPNIEFQDNLRLFMREFPMFTVPAPIVKQTVGELLQSFDEATELINKFVLSSQYFKRDIGIPLAHIRERVNLVEGYRPLIEEYEKISEEFKLMDSKKIINEVVLPENFPIAKFILKNLI